jgi:hypothetical protein
VIPLHVVAGFLESERGMSDSGVRPVNAMVQLGSLLVAVDKCE